MFMAMKREVLRLGGYEREFFVSQTPELTAMADAVIDLDALQTRAPLRRPAWKPELSEVNGAELPDGQPGPPDEARMP
jgi:hypothetical protein